MCDWAFEVFWRLVSGWRSETTCLLSCLWSFLFTVLRFGSILIDQIFFWHILAIGGRSTLTRQHGLRIGYTIWWKSPSLARCQTFRWGDSISFALTSTGLTLMTHALVLHISPWAWQIQVLGDSKGSDRGWTCRTVVIHICCGACGNRLSFKL